MHGRLKIRTDAEKAEAERKKNQERAAKFKAGSEAVFQMRSSSENDVKALSLMEQLLLANPDFYTLWNYRREILIRCKGKIDDGADVQDASDFTRDQFDLLCQKELALSTSCLVKNPKSYGTWHHRYWIISNMYQPDFKSEIDLCNSALHKDSRNFHCWHYRRFLFRMAKIDVLQEIDFTEKKIEENFSNFSAWYLRSTLLTEASKSGLLDLRQVWEKEYRKVENAIFTDPHDQSAWFYHKWLSSIELGARPDRSNKNVQDIVIRQVVWFRIRNTLMITFDRALESCPEVVIQSADGITEENIHFRPLSDDQLQPSFYAQVQTFTKSTIFFQGIKIALEADHDVIVLNHFDTDQKEDRVLPEENVKNLLHLEESEPDNKWVNLAMTFHRDERISTLQRLCQIDPCHSSYYQDHASQIIAEKSLNGSEMSCSLILKSMQLSHIPFLYRLTHVRFLDVSGNRLQVLSRALNQLVCLQTLILDNNLISDVSVGIHLLNLEVLSLVNNQIQSRIVLQRLTDCPKLETIYIHGNPCASNVFGVQEENPSCWSLDENRRDLLPIEGSVSVNVMTTEKVV